MCSRAHLFNKFVRSPNNGIWSDHILKVVRILMLYRKFYWSVIFSSIENEKKWIEAFELWLANVS